MTATIHPDAMGAWNRKGAGEVCRYSGAVAATEHSTLHWGEVEEPSVPAQISGEELLRQKLLAAAGAGDFTRLAALTRDGAPLTTRCPCGNLVDYSQQHGSPAAAICVLEVADACGLGAHLARDSLTAVHRAANLGQSQLLQALLSRGAPVVQCSSGESALHAACRAGHRKAIAILLEAGAWVLEPQKEAARAAARASDVADLLPVPPEQEKSVMRAVEDLEKAVLDRDRARVEALAKQGGAWALLPHHRSQRGQQFGEEHGCVNPVDWAALHDRPEVARWLLELGDHLVCSDAERLAPTCRYALHRALQPGLQGTHGEKVYWLDLLNGLLARQADVAQLDPSGRTALHLAALRSKPEDQAFLEILLRHGAWAMEPQKEEVLLHARSRHLRPVLEAAGVAAPAAEAAAAEVQTLEEVAEEQRRMDGQLALAVRKGNMARVQAALHRGANLAMRVDLASSIEGNLVDLALEHGHEECALALLHLGEASGLGERLASGARFAVFWAVQHNTLPVLQALLKMGADPRQKDSTCGWPLEFALAQARPEAAALLLRAGALTTEALAAAALPEVAKDDAATVAAGAVAAAADEFYLTADRALLQQLAEENMLLHADEIKQRLERGESLERVMPLVLKSAEVVETSKNASS